MSDKDGRSVPRDLPETVQDVLQGKCGHSKGAQSQNFELFWPGTKLPLHRIKPENNSLLR